MINRDELAQMMGEDAAGSAATLPLYPIVSLHGEKGYFRKLKVDEKDRVYLKPAEMMGKVVNGVVVATRMLLSEYTKQYRRFTNEYSSSSEHLRLFEVRGENRTKLMEGTEKEIRERYQGLRSHRWLYMLMGDAVVKFRVKGSGFTGYFEYLRELRKQKKHLFEVETLIEPNQLHNEDLDKDYYAPNFKAVRDIPEEVIEKDIAPVIQELKTAFDATVLKVSVVPVLSPVEGSDGDHLPEIDVEEDGDIRPENIPF